MQNIIDKLMSQQTHTYDTIKNIICSMNRQIVEPIIITKCDFSKIKPSIKPEVIMADLIYTPKKAGYLLMILVGGGGCNCGGSGYVEIVVLNMVDVVPIDITVGRGCKYVNNVADSCGGTTSIKINDKPIACAEGGGSGRTIRYHNSCTRDSFRGGEGFSGGGASFGPHSGGYYGGGKGFSGGKNGGDGENMSNGCGKGSKSNIIDELHKIYPIITAGEGGAGAQKAQVGDGYYGVRGGSQIGYGGGAGGLKIEDYNVSGSNRSEFVHAVSYQSQYFEAYGGIGFGAGGASFSDGADGCVIIDYIDYS